jgi:hypothetical protein
MSLCCAFISAPQTTRRTGPDLRLRPQTSEIGAKSRVAGQRQRFISNLSPRQGAPPARLSARPAGRTRHEPKAIRCRSPCRDRRHVPGMLRRRSMRAAQAAQGGHPCRSSFPRRPEVQRQGYTSRRAYQRAIIAGGPRYDLDGNVAGNVTDTDIEYAQKRLRVIEVHMSDAQERKLQQERQAQTHRKRVRAGEGWKAFDALRVARISREGVFSGPRLSLDGLRAAARARKARGMRDQVQDAHSHQS